MGAPDHPTVELPGIFPDLAAAARRARLDPPGIRDELVAALTGDTTARAGHLCASAWALDRDLTHTLLVRHPRFGWMPPGGHAVAGETIEQTAARELAEETGTRPDAQHVLSVAGTMIPATATVPAHMHYTFGVVNVVDRSAPLAGEDGQQAAWWPLSDPLPESFFGDNPLARDFAAMLA